MRFWEALEEVVRGVPSAEKIVVAGDFNGHIGALSGGFRDVHGGFGFGERNEEGATLLEFARAFGLVVVNSGFPKKDEHLITFRSAIVRTQIDFLLLRKGDRALCKDCKVIPKKLVIGSRRKLLMGRRRDVKLRRSKWLGMLLKGCESWKCSDLDLVGILDTMGKDNKGKLVAGDVEILDDDEVVEVDTLKVQVKGVESSKFSDLVGWVLLEYVAFKSVAALATLDTARDVNIARGLTRIVEGRRRQKQQKKKQPED
ncbi:hypothetical protein FXO37_33924 [Capsicum annuum]|nr:hypothetical protein FXO37_33924 [Capsicum annuum]